MQIVRDAQLETRTARARLKVQKKPYYRLLDEGIHLGYRRGSGVWTARLYNGNGTYRHAKLGTADDKADADGVAVLSFADAQAAARKLFVQAARSAAGAPAASGSYTVAKAIDDYLLWLEGQGRSRQSITGMRGKAAGLIVPKLGNVRVDRLARKQIEDWQHALAKSAPRLRVKAGAKQRYRDVDLRDGDVRRQRQASTNRVMAILRAALNHAWRNEIVSDDKAWRKVKPFRNATASRARYLALDECRRLINGCDPDFRDLVRGGLHSGCRYSELCRLAPGDFNRDAGLLSIRTSKSGKPRHVILADDGVEFFEQMVAKAGRRPHLFARDDGAQWKTSWQIRLMVEACRRAGIEPSIGFHGLRHTWASHAVMGGAPLMVVAKNLGHADTRMVEMHYAHLAPSYVADEIRRAVPRFERATGDVVTPIRRRR